MNTTHQHHFQLNTGRTNRRSTQGMVHNLRQLVNDTPNLYAPDNAARNSTHPMDYANRRNHGWSIGGSEYFEDSYGIGDAYEGKWIGSIIISGVLYYHKQEAVHQIKKSLQLTYTLVKSYGKIINGSKDVFWSNH